MVGPSNNSRVLFERRMQALSQRGLPAIMGRYFRLIVDNFSLTKKKSYDIARYGQLTSIHSPTTMDRTLASAGMYVEGAFFGGSKRVVGRNGKFLRLNPITNFWAVSYLQRNQFRYLRNLEQYQQNKIGDILHKGAIEGKSIRDMSLEIQGTTDSITRGRANTISRAEMIHSHSLGLLQTMKENEIDKYIWMANYNPGVGKDRTPCVNCQAFHKQSFRTDLPIYQGNISEKSVSAAKGLIARLKKNYAFLPSRTTHPSCRCTLIADVLG